MTWAVHVPEVLVVNLRAALTKDPHACAFSGPTSNNPRSASCAHRSYINWHRLFHGRLTKIHKQSNENNNMIMHYKYIHTIPYFEKYTNICAWLCRICVSTANVLVFLLICRVGQLQSLYSDKLHAGKCVFNSRNLVASPTFSSSPWLPADICRQRCCSWRCSSSASVQLMRIRRRAPSFLPKVGGFTHYIHISACWIHSLCWKSLSSAASWQ